nr:hypothetical protein [Tanacetum cinerariifolium]
TFILGLENLLSFKVKVIRCDNETEFKNSALNQFCGLKGIKREFSVPKTPQQNGIAERKNRTLIEAVRTLLVDSFLSIPFWAEAVNTACYVQNRVLVTKPHNKTPYELLHGKFQGKVDEGFLVGYSVCSLQDTEKAEEEGTHTYKSVSPCIHSTSSGDQTRKQEFEECTNNSSNGVNAASSSVSTARHNFINNTNEFSAAGPSNTAVSPTVANSSSQDASTSSHDSD